MTYQVVDFVSDQLKALAPSAEWDASGHDRARELAQILVRAGIRDLSKVGIAKRDFLFSDGNLSETVTDYVLTYEGRDYGYLGEPNRPSNGYQKTILKRWVTNQRGNQQMQSKVVDIPALQGSLIAWSAEGHGNVGYHLTPTNTGLAIIPVWASSSDLDQIRNLLKTVAIFAVTVVMPAAGYSAANAIGAAAMGSSAAAAYPAVASAIGNAALGVAFNGGDVEAAVKNAVTGAVGGQIGNFVGAGVASATDMQVVGRLAAAAARAYITGGNVAQAVAFAAAANGVEFYDEVTGPSNSPPVPEIEPLPIPEIVVDEGQNMDYEYNFSTGDDSGFTFNPNNNDFEFLFESQPASFFNDPVASPGYQLPPEQFLTYNYELPQFSVPIPNVESQSGFFPTALQQEPLIELPEIPALPSFPATSPFETGFQPATSISQLTAEPPIRASDPVSFDTTRQIIQTLSQAALATLQVMATYRQINPRTPINAVARTYNSATGQTQVTLDSGVVQIRNPNGTISNVMPPKGEPQATATGNVIVNNGDGTYTLIAPNGSQRRIQYAPGAVNSSSVGDASFNLSDIPTPVIISGIGILAVLLTRRR